jgi:hypothetical protein
MQGLEMIKVYEIKPNGHIGATKEIDPREGVTAGWTYTAPPNDETHRWEDGAWVPSIEPVSSDPAMSSPQSSSDVRVERNKRLADTDWTQHGDVPAGTAAKWAPYRQALRDVSSQEGFPFFVEWPDKPE